MPMPEADGPPASGLPAIGFGLPPALLRRSGAVPGHYTSPPLPRPKPHLTSRLGVKGGEAIACDASLRAPLTPRLDVEHSRARERRHQPETRNRTTEQQRNQDNYAYSVAGVVA